MRVKFEFSPFDKFDLLEYNHNVILIFDISQVEENGKKANSVNSEDQIQFSILPAKK